MKKAALLILFFNLFLLNTYSQSSTCETRKENNLDLNEISIKKCEIIENQSNVRRIIKTTIVRKRIINRLRKKSNHLEGKGSNINSKINNKHLNLLNHSKEVLFTLVEEIPMFESCERSNKKNNIKCFKNKITRHFSKNFNADKFIDEITKGKIFIQFSIGIDGKVINPKIKSKKNNKSLHKELNRILYKLPRFNTGKEKGFPVIVTYSFPLNLELN